MPPLQAAFGCSPGIGVQDPPPAPSHTHGQADTSGATPLPQFPPSKWNRGTDHSLAETHPNLHPVLPQCWEIWGCKAQRVGGEGLQTLPLPSGLCNPMPSTTGKAGSPAPSLLLPGLPLCPPQQKLGRDAAPRTLPKQSRVWGSPACPPWAPHFPSPAADTQQDGMSCLSPSPA